MAAVRSWMAAVGLAKDQAMDTWKAVWSISPSFSFSSSLLVPNSTFLLFASRIAASVVTVFLLLLEFEE